jgi:hypothetical protein
MAHYRIVQAHHDHCPHGTLNASSSAAVHTYEDICGEGCYIQRQYDASLDQCPTVNCNSAPAMSVAVKALANNNCATDCTGGCGAAFQQVVAFHDSCTGDQLLPGLEAALHLYEEVCDDAICNTHNAYVDPNACSEHDTEDDLEHDLEHDTEQDHQKGEVCGCAAAAGGWTIDCSSMAPVNAAFERFKDGRCDANCRADGDGHCLTLYRIIQSHHDHCPHGTFTATMVADFHSYENGCGEGCVIGRQFDSALQRCPQVDCTSTRGMKAAVGQLVNEHCLTECGTNLLCAAAFQEVVAFHDTCDHGDITFALEMALHQYEDVCDVAVCNTQPAMFDANICDDDSGDHDIEHSSATKHNQAHLEVVAGATAGAVVALVAVVVLRFRAKSQKSASGVTEFSNPHFNPNNAEGELAEAASLA